MRMVFKFQGRDVEQSKAWKEVLDFLNDVGVQDDAEVNHIRPDGFRFFLRTNNLEGVSDKRIDALKERIKLLADRLNCLSREAQAELYTDAGEEIFSYLRHDVSKSAAV